MRPQLRHLATAVFASLSALTLNASATSAPALPQLPAGLRAIVAANIPVEQPLLSVATLGRVPTAEDVAALEAEGLTVQPLKHLPLALTKGTWPQLLRVFQQGKARDLYLDQQLRWASEESTASINANLTRDLGYTGEGIGIAIVDSGIDASHPILKPRVVRNVRVYSPEYLDVTGISQLGVPIPSSPALVIPFDALPYNNTDTIGHGTHVAGIAAGDGDVDAALVGVAPKANLIGYSTGEILFIFTALAAFDDILANQAEYNIRVINNSWGSAYQTFNPDAPINLATKVLHDAGITVVFSAGNSQDEMATGPNAHAPWVINVCSGTINKEKSSFSSSGLMYDNTTGAALDENRHVHYEGDGLGITRPDICAPGSDIVSSGTPTGVTATTGTPPGGSATLSGTSMAAPHVAGLAAVLLSAKPDLTPDQIRQVLEVTAVPMADDSQFWQTGYGWVDAKAAVDLVTGEDFSQEVLDEKTAELDEKFLARRPYKVLASDHWIYTELLGSVAGLVSQEYIIDVKPDAEAIRASIAFPGDLGAAGLNVLFNWSLDLIDPDGNVVATSSLISLFSGTGVLQYDAPEGTKTLKPGNWTVKASGQLHLAQPGLLWGHLISVAATQLAKNENYVEAEGEEDDEAKTGRFGGAVGLAALFVLLGAGTLRRKTSRHAGML